MGFGVGTDVHMDSHMTTTISEIDRLQKFLRFGAPLVCLRHAGAPLKSPMSSIGAPLRPKQSD